MMKQLLCGMLTAGFLCVCSASSEVSAGTSSPYFIENTGQVVNQHYEARTDIDFKFSSNGVNLFVSSTSLHYHWYRSAGFRTENADTLHITDIYRLDVALVDAAPDAAIVPDARQDYYERYYSGRTGQEGAVSHAYQKITYKNVYPHIDWVLYTRDGRVEYDFIIHPGGRVSDIKLKYAGASSLQINPDGSLTAFTPFGTVTEAAPVSFQMADGSPVRSSFHLEGDILSFRVADYTGTLVIDPVLEWATYFGGIGDESVTSNNTAGYGDDAVYMIGNTPSTTNIATTGSHQETIAGGTDGFIAKFDMEGILLWCTYYGGSSSSEGITGIACDSEGNVIFCGHSQSVEGIATAGSYQAERAGGRDAYLVKMTDAGERLWGTYYGGTAQDQALAVSIDSDDNIFICGFTQSVSGIVTPDAYQTVKASTKDAYMAKFDSDGDLLWGTYFGGTGHEEGFALACDSEGNAYMGGWTQSTDGIATVGVHQEVLAGNRDVFITKFSASGDRLWGTYFGGANLDEVYSLCSDGENIYFTGVTKSPGGIAAEGALRDTIAADWDAYITKMGSEGSVIWSTYFGGGAEESSEAGPMNYGNALIYDVNTDHIFMTGSTRGLPSSHISDAFQDEISGTMSDAYIARFDNSGELLWATYYGGDASDDGFGLYVTPGHEMFLGGRTHSLFGMSTEGGHQPEHGGSSTDLFLIKVNVCMIAPVESVTGDDEVCAHTSTILSADILPGMEGFAWILPEGWSGSSESESISIAVDGHSGHIGVVAMYPCGYSDTTWTFITVLPVPEPLITISGPLLSTGAYSSYQWYHNDELIAGAAAATYIITEFSGEYHVVVTDDNGCQGVSEKYNPEMSGTDGLGGDNQFSVFPNPSSGSVSIESPFGISHIMITEVTGRVILSTRDCCQIDLSAVPDGLYWLMVVDDAGEYRGAVKLIKRSE